MRDKRAIIIKDPRLQRIRNNLRNLIIQTYHKEFKKLFDKMEKIERDNTGKYRSVDDMTPGEKDRFRSLQEQENQLSNALDRSILICVACGKGERDMVYNKAYNAWYCTECYGMESSVAQRRARTSRGSSKAKSCEDKALQEHSKTFL